MKHLSEVFDRNRRWAERVAKDDPDLLARLAQEQQPIALWIGCSDSRVPVSLIAGLRPGEIFEHRNIANVVPADDINVQSVLAFAVDALRVHHVVVCGHYRCGGVDAALDGSPVGVVDAWLGPIRAVARAHAGELGALPDDDARRRRLCELNVLAQARNVDGTSTVTQARQRGHTVTVHAWIYDLADGRIRDLGFADDGKRADASGAQPS